MAREKARLVIAERTKIKRETEEPVSEPEETEPLTPPPASPAARLATSALDPRRDLSGIDMAEKRCWPT